MVLLTSASADDLKWNVTSECQMIVLPQKVALSLLPGLKDEAKSEAGMAKVQDLIAKGEATLAAHLIAKSKNNEKVEAETAEELRYATEHNPPQLPVNAPEDIEVLKAWPVVAISPISFETRNVGQKLEADVRVGEDGKVLSVGAVVQHTRFLRWAKTDAGTLANGKQLFVEQPIFHVAKNTCSLTMRNGQWILVGVHKLVEPAETLEIFLLKVSASPAP